MLQQELPCESGKTDLPFQKSCPCDAFFCIQTTNNVDFPLCPAHSCLCPKHTFTQRVCYLLFIKEEPVFHTGLQEKKAIRKVNPLSGSISPFALPLRSKKVGWRWRIQKQNRFSWTPRAISANTDIALTTPEQTHLCSVKFLVVRNLALISSLTFKQFVLVVLLPMQSINLNTTQALSGFNFASFLHETFRCHRFCWELTLFWLN